jgi:hypothetical protein
MTQPGRVFLVMVAFEGVPYRLAESRATKPFFKNKYQLQGMPADLSLKLGSCRLECSYAPLERNLGQLEYIFIKRIPSTVMRKITHSRHGPAPPWLRPLANKQPLHLMTLYVRTDSKSSN